jgi:hypothetical protein
VTLSPADPRHGSVAGRVAGCGCQPCLTAINRYKATRIRRTAYGTWQPFVDAEPVRQHLRDLSAAGIGWERAAALAGLADATVSGILYGRGGRKPASRCRQRTAGALLAVRASIDTAADAGLIDPTGTLRRLRALVAIGWSMQHIGERMPGHPEATRVLIRKGRPRVTGATARAARDLYRELATTPPADSWSVRRTRRMAAKLGWVSPMAWDAATIDDPAAEPFADLPVTAEPDVDWVAVDRALKGMPVRLTLLERHHAVHAGRDRGWPYARIANALRMSVSRTQELGAKPLPEDCEVAA